MRKCPRCGNQYPDSEGFCEADGVALIEASSLPRARMTSVMTEETHPEQSLECPVCGGKSLPGEVRCNYCGARLRAEGSEPAEPTPSVEASTSQIFPPAESPSGP